MAPSLLLMSAKHAPSVAFEIVLENLKQSNIPEKEYLSFELLLSSFKNIKTIIEQINFLSKLPGRPNSITISEILGISSSHFYRVSRDPTYFPNQKSISRSIPPKQNLLSDNEKYFILSSIKENQNNHRCMTPKMIRLLASDLFYSRTGQTRVFDRKWWGRFLHRNEGTISVQYLSSLEESRASVKNLQLGNILVS